MYECTNTLHLSNTLNICRKFFVMLNLLCLLPSMCRCLFCAFCACWVQSFAPRLMHHSDMRIYYASMQQRVDKIQHFFFVALVSSMSIHLIFATKKLHSHRFVWQDRCDGILHPDFCVHTGTHINKTKVQQYLT